jgi:hypothetical protein
MEHDQNAYFKNPVTAPAQSKMFPAATGGLMLEDAAAAPSVS